ncbi:hypothetical protein AB1207_04370 [Kineococcus endophyticus]|uniref:Uncharacterized protein n=1 Tax=Kineococcus endophyticus TaxID=1181883 RepID=A0ABV3P2X7_9ACTN
MHGHEWDDDRAWQGAAPAVVAPAALAATPSPLAPARRPGLAVLLTFLWLGAGNCYAGQVGLGVTLALVQLVCLPLAGLFASITLGVSLLVSVPVWLAAVAVAGASAHARCRELLVGPGPDGS